MLVVIDLHREWLMAGRVGGWVMNSDSTHPWRSLSRSMAFIEPLTRC
jgi:hypothetical protein